MLKGVYVMGRDFCEPGWGDYSALIDLAYGEDFAGGGGGVVGGDVTSEVTVPSGQEGEGALVFREGGVLCGMSVVGHVLRRYDAGLVLEAMAGDGDVVAAGATVGVVRGRLRSLLAAERVVLNFLQRLSGVATVTGRYVAAVAGCGAAICDTRKTTPGWRVLEKYAVRCGGGVNHRVGLYDAVLIKDNHLAAMEASGSAVGSREGLAGLLAEAVGRIRADGRKVSFVEVEVDTLDQLREVLTVEGVDMVLLDNMTSEEMRAAVALRDELAGGRGVLLEASGNVTLETVRAAAETGVDRISVGALTHSVRSLDIGLDMKG